MPLHHSARSACVSRTFLRSWKCFPNLCFTEEALGLKQKARRDSDLVRAFVSRVDHILKNHSGVGVKTLKFIIYDHYNVDNHRLNNWLQGAITPGIEEVTLSLPRKYREESNFPCSIFHNGCGSSIKYLHLRFCAFRPTAGFACMRSLSTLYLYKVYITGDELGYLFSNSFALKHLTLCLCDELICLKIPFWLEQLSFLNVTWCNKLQVIESTAPNLSTLHLVGDPVQISFGKSSQVKNLSVGLSYEPNIISYAITKLPSYMTHLETLTVSSTSESINMPMVADKFLHLKYLKICLSMDRDDFSPAYDYLYLARFLDAAPLLETFILSIEHEEDMQHDSAFGDASLHMRQIPGQKYDRLKKAQINGFCSAKSMAELTCHILENATSLEILSLDTVHKAKQDGKISRCSVEKSGKCRPLRSSCILEAHKALWVVRRYILERIPSTVKVNVGEPCSWCNAIDVKALQLPNI